MSPPQARVGPATRMVATAAPRRAVANRRRIAHSSVGRAGRAGRPVRLGARRRGARTGSLRTGTRRCSTYHRPMDRDAPPEIQDAARRRSEARAQRDWATADRLRDEIEAAGWKVVDSGTAFRLERASPPDVEVGGETRYGRSEAVPSRLGEPATGLATVVVVASTARDETAGALEG